MNIFAIIWLTYFQPKSENFENENLTANPNLPNFGQHRKIPDFSLKISSFQRWKNSIFAPQIFNIFGL